MTDALIYDAVRTPRGKGKKDGSLHQVTPVHLLTDLFEALKTRKHWKAVEIGMAVLKARDAYYCVSQWSMRGRIANAPLLKLTVTTIT